MPWDGFAITRPALIDLAACNQTLQECKESYNPPQTYESSYAIAGTVTGAIVLALFCSAVHCKF